MAYGEFAKIYDNLIYEDINYDDMSEFILNICKENNIDFNNYLDLACGTGNVTIRLGKSFKSVFAVDLSEEMLNEAFLKLKQNKIKSKIICQDMSELSLNNKFDLITSVLDSTNYILEENLLIEYFKGVYNHLNDNGLFIFDINSYYKLSQVLGNNIYTYSEEDIFYSWENVFEDDIVSMFLTFFIKEDTLYKRVEEEHLERAYTEEYLENIIKDIGFKIIKKQDNYSDNIVNDKSERIVYVLKKI